MGLDLPRGATLGIGGESGGGKSTLAGLIAGVFAGHAGTIRLDGAPLAGLARGRPADLRRRVQMVFPDPLASLNPQHGVEALIARLLRLFLGLSRAAARDPLRALLAELELDPGIMTRFPRRLSGGQQQRVAIARAFASKPDLLICDESTSTLDVTVLALVLDTMQRLRRDRGTGYVVIAHDLPMVARMSDTVIVLHGGRITDIAAPAALIAGRCSPYARALLAAFRANAGHVRHLSERTAQHVD